MAAIGIIRNRFGWFLMIMMVIALLSFLMMDIGGGGNNSYQVDDQLSVVDGEVVSNLDFEDNLNTNIINYQNNARKTELTDDDMSYLKNATYNQLVLDKLLTKVYKKTGIVVSNAEYADMLGGKNIHPSIKSSFVDSTGQFSAELLRNFLNNLDVENTPQDEPGTKRKSWESFETAILKERKEKKYMSLVEKSFTVPTFMAKDDFSSKKTQVTFSYVKVPFSTIADSTLNITDKDITDFIAKYPKKHKQEASVDLKFAKFNIVASENDILGVQNEISKKTKEWATIETGKDSAFVTLYSDVPFDNTYYGRNELINPFKDTIFNSQKGAIFGPNKEGNSFASYKLIDKKMIADSLKARHLLISFENLQTQEEANAKYILFDSLYNLVDSLGVEVSSLTTQFSEDPSNANNGGDLNWVKPNQMVKPFNDMIFFNMKEGDVKKVATKFGLHIIEVYKADLTKEAVQVATIRKTIEPSTKTQEKIYANASRFYGNNNSKEKFEAAEETTTIYSANAVSNETSTIQGINGNAREIIRWAFQEEKEGIVSTPFAIDNAYYVLLLNNKNEKGLMKVNDNNRLFLRAAVAKDKKAEIIKGKMSGADLNSIATNNGVEVTTAQNISFVNTNIGGTPEPKIAGVSLVIAENTICSPIQGNEGVYVISVTSRTVATEDLAAIEAAKSQMQTSFKADIANQVKDALKNEADIKDNRFNFF